MKWYQDGDGNTSGKRIFGAIGFTLYLIMAIIVLPVYSLFTGNDIGSNVIIPLNAAGGFSAGLLGLGVLEGFVKKKQEVTG
jgi:hypothetical protein